MQIVEKISKASGLPQQKVLQAGLALVVLFIVFGVGASLLTNIIGVAYPAFMSFVALESEGTDDDKLWLTYWVVFGSFTIVDQFAGIILRLIPFYYVLKVGMLIWMFHPSTQGAITLYDNFVLPFVKQYESQFDEIAKKTESVYNSSTTGISGNVANTTHTTKVE